MSTSYFIPASIYLLIDKYYANQIESYSIHTNKNNCIDKILIFFLTLESTSKEMEADILTIISSLKQRKSAINDIYMTTIKKFECCNDYV